MTTDVDEILRDSAPMPNHALDMRGVRWRAQRLQLARRAWIGLCALGLACAMSVAAVLLVRTTADDHGEQPQVITPATNTTVFDPNGDTVNLPAGWFRATEPLTPLIDPHEILTLATFPLPTAEQPAVCVGDAPPAKALAAMGASDALVWIVEWTPLPAPSTDLVPNAATTGGRPSRFTPDKFASRDCVAQSNPRLVGRELLFTQHGRVFDVFVVTGTGIAPSREREIYESLDSLRFSGP